MEKLRTVHVYDEGQGHKGAFHGWFQVSGRGPVALIEDLKSGCMFEEWPDGFRFDPPYGALIASPSFSKNPPWAVVAYAEMGVKEISGPDSNPQVEKYHETTTMGTCQDDVPWCASFVSYCMEASGSKAVQDANIHSARARDWLGWGYPIDTPVPGCVVVFSRPPNPASGHVGFYDQTSDGQVYVLGGNQSNEVNITGYAEDRVLGYRWMDW